MDVELDVLVTVNFSLYNENGFKLFDKFSFDQDQYSQILL